MKQVVSGEEMQRLDQYSINELGFSSLALMEQAASAVCQVICEKYPEKHQGKILVVSGTGNNGGDGIAVARMLSGKGYRVAAFLCNEDETKWSEGFCYQRKIAKHFPIQWMKELDFSGVTLVVDSIFGVGLSREITGLYAEYIQKINKAGLPTVAVDCPSGVDMNTGKILGCGIQSSVTVTFGKMKLGLLLYPGAQYAGEIFVREIGFPELAYSECVKEQYRMLDEDCLKYIPKRKEYSNKGTFGKVAIVAGSKNMAGAAVMAAKACYGAGAGLVKIITCEENREIVQVNVPEAILFTYQELSVKQVEEELAWANTILVGPGLSVSENAQQLVELCLKAHKNLVVDADALNILSANENLQKLVKNTGAIFTPHLGEMARLTGKAIRELQNDLVNICKTYAEEQGIILVLKDARTLVSDGNQVYINTSGNCGMAKAGSGDVLAGILAGLLGSEQEHRENVLRAAGLGVYIHGAAGDVAAEKMGKHSMSSLDTIRGISEIFKKVEAGKYENS